MPLTLFERFVCVRGSWWPNRTAIYWPPLLWPSALCLSRSPGLLNRRPGGLALLSTGFFYHIFSLTHLISNSIGGPKGQDGSFPYHIYSNSSDLQLNWLPVLTELYNSSIVHSISPHNLPSEICHFCCPWDGMFDCHRAEIIVMQFTGHSLPMHQSISVPWDFYLVPFFQPSPPTRFLLKTAIGMCHFLPVYHFRMACLAGSKVSIQHYFKQYSLAYVQFFVNTPLNAKAVLFQAIQLRISTLFSSTWSIDRTLSVATTPGRCEFWKDSKERVLHIPQRSSITEVSSSDCFVSCLEHSLEESYPSVVIQSVYSTVPRLEGAPFE